MAKKRNRPFFATTIDPDIFTQIKETKERTGIPASKQVDKALESYFKELRRRAGV